MTSEMRESVTVSIEPLKDKSEIEAFLRANPELHVYSLGDLDDFFWPQTTWYGWRDKGALQDLILIYAGTALPTVVAITEQPDRLGKHLPEIIPLLPPRFYAHLSPGLENVLAKTHGLDSQGPHYKMALRDTSRLAQIDASAAVRLGPPDLDDLLRLYEQSYPDNWFDPRMLQTSQYFGLRVEGQLVSAAGIHVYSPHYRVAAVGNIVTHPAHRSKGYAGLVTARLCQSLLEKADHIGLNVKTDNAAALSCYRHLGFQIVAPYGEFTVERTASLPGKCT
jgi:GNAT superfamily N-acetyltransferase